MLGLAKMSSSSAFAKRFVGLGGGADNVPAAVVVVMVGVSLCLDLVIVATTGTGAFGNFASGALFFLGASVDGDIFALVVVVVVLVDFGAGGAATLFFFLVMMGGGGFLDTLMGFLDVGGVETVIVAVTSSSVVVEFPAAAAGGIVVGVLACGPASFFILCKEQCVSNVIGQSNMYSTAIYGDSIIT